MSDGPVSTLSHMEALTSMNIPALDADDLDEVGRRILDEIEACWNDDLLYGGSPDKLDPSGWTRSTFPEAARRIARAITDRAEGGDGRTLVRSVNGGWDLEP